MHPLNLIRASLISLSIIALFAFVAGCGVPDEPVGSMTFKEETVGPPVMCGPNGTCPTGLICADDNHCGVPCGVNFSCSLGWYCYAFGPGHVNHDCLPAGSCVYADGGCS